MIGLINVVGPLVSAFWKGLSSNEGKKRKLIDGLSTSIPLGQFKHDIIGKSDQIQGCELRVYAQAPSSNSSLDLIYRAVYKLFTGDWVDSKKPHFLEIEFSQSNSSLVKVDSNQENEGGLAVVSRNEGFFSQASFFASKTCQIVSSAVSTSVVGVYNTFVRNPFSSQNYPSKEELIKRLEAPILLNQSRIDHYGTQYQNATQYHNTTNSSRETPPGFNETDFSLHFDKFFQNTREKLSTPCAPLLIVFAGALYLGYKKICENRRNKVLKKFRILSKKALINDRFKKIEKENNKLQELKLESRISLTALPTPEINFENLPSLEQSKVKILQEGSSRAKNEFSRALIDVKKLFNSDSEPLSLTKIYKFIVL